jgi:hypothetical protein
MELRYPTDLAKLYFGYGFGLLFFFGCLAIAFFAGENLPLQVALCLLGVTSGWVTGILASPLGDEETKTFTDLAQGFLALGSGFVVAKFDTLIVSEVTKAVHAHGELFALRGALFAICFLVGFLFTIVTRLYDTDPVKRKKEKLIRLQRAIKRAQERLADAEAEPPL